MARTQILPNGTGFETFEIGELPAVGQIVMIPDGRAAEVMDLMLGEGGRIGNDTVWVFARPWDQHTTQAFMAHEIEPWEEAN